MKVLHYIGNMLQLSLISGLLFTCYSITPDGGIMFKISPFLVYICFSCFLTGPLLLPKLNRLTHHWYLSSKEKQSYFHFREKIHQSPYLFDPVKFLAEPQDIGKNEELQNFSGYLVLLVLTDLFSPVVYCIFLIIKFFRGSKLKHMLGRLRKQ